MDKSKILPQFFCQVLAKEYACHMSTFVWWKIDEKSRVRNEMKYPSVSKGIRAFAKSDDDDDDKDDDDDDDDVQYVNKGCKQLPSNVFADRSGS